MDSGSSVKEALKNVVERKLMGTWKLAVLGTEQPDSLYLVKNSGDLILGQDKNSVVVSTTDLIFTGEDTKGIQTQKIPSNHLVELKDDCTYKLEKLEKKIQVDRQPKPGYDFIFEEEIYESADAVNQAIDFGRKFITNH